MIRARLWFALVFAALAAFTVLVGGCRSCSRDAHVAEVTKTRADVKRDTASSVQSWEPAGVGAKLAMGDGLKTGHESEAVLRLVRGGAVAVTSDTTIRFVTSAGGGNPKLAVETGEASLEADEQAIAMETTIGLAQIEPGGKLRVSAADGSTRVEVTVGAARIDTEDGGVSLAPGKSFEVALGGAIIERETRDAAAPPTKEERVAEEVPPADAGPRPIVLDVRGSGVRVQSRGNSTWRAASEGGDTAAPGDTLEVPNGAVVEVREGARRGRLVGEGRFVIAEGEGGALVRARSGRVELETSAGDVAVEVPGGVIVAKSGGPDGKSRVSAEVRATGTRVSVRQGQAEVRGSGATERLQAGEIGTLNPKGALALASRRPERADFTIRAGESVTVRDPRPPTALGFDVSSACPGTAVVSRGDGTTTGRGERQAAMYFPAGHHEYAVRCVGPDGIEEKPAAKGTVTIVADPARAELPRLPPSTVVDTDGRRYTVLYQNLLPSVVARWPDAPAGKGFVLRLDSQRLRSEAARQSLKSGTVGEGTHALWFETEDGSKRSAETTLVIKFDNAAPAASVREPADGSFQAGDTVRVAGVVVEGWTVSVNGQAVPLDDQKRFSTTATVPSGENAIVLRLTHAKRGTVYYVRHAKGTR